MPVSEGVTVSKTEWLGEQELMEGRNLWGVEAREELGVAKSKAHRLAVNLKYGSN